MIFRKFFSQYRYRYIVALAAMLLAFFGSRVTLVSEAAEIRIFQLNPGEITTRPMGTLTGQLAQLIVPAQPAIDNAAPVDEPQVGIEQFDTNLIKPVELREIIVQGNQRISEGRILDFFAFKIGQTVNAALVNTGLQKLFRSGLFEFFEADLNSQGVLTISVTESPLINRVAFEGNSSLKDEMLQTIVSSRARLSYSVSMIDADTRAIQTAYRQLGRYAAEVKPVIIERDQNRVDVVFEIIEGNKTRVESISFVGNRFASEKILRDEMITKRNSIFSYVFGGDTYDPDKLLFDTDNIRNYYLRHGFVDFRIISAVSELDALGQGFHITITMEEGEQYSFGDITVESEIPEVDMLLVQAQALEIDAGETFDNTVIQDVSLAIENNVQRQGIPFVRVVPNVEKDEEGLLIHARFVITPGPKRYVEEINVNNNVRTLDYVIRRELTIAEGDPLSLAKIQESEQRINDLGFFKKVEIIQRQGTFANDTILDVNVEEKSTGRIDAGLGLSTSSGAFARLGIAEDNFLGQGQKISLSTTLSADRRNYSFSFTEPRFLERDLAATYSINRLDNINNSEREYDLYTESTSVSFSQQLFEDVYNTFSLGLSRSNIANTDNASAIIQQQRGTIKRINLSQSLYYSNEGFNIGGSMVYSGFLDDYSALKTVLESSYTMPVGEHSELNVNGKIGYLKDFGQTKSRVSDNFFLGGETSLRGFKPSGIGPRTNLAGDDDALGGQRLMKGSINLKLPSGLPRHVGIDLIAFSDFGLLRSHGQNTAGVPINDSGKVRASVGLGVQLKTLLPISILLTRPISYEPWDKTENLVISIGISL